MKQSFEARVTAVFGRHVLVERAEGDALEARVFGRRLSVVCGDRVECEHQSQTGEVHVVQTLPRKSALYRANLRGESEPVVANLSHLVVVVAPMPTPDWFIVDRYLAAAASTAIRASVLLNKIDIGASEEIQRELAVYEQCGCAQIACSARESAGLDAVLEACRDEVSVLVGQSGTGKSSLLGKLVPGSDALTGTLVRDEEGRHTTTASRLYQLPGGGQLIDSPGVRDFAPALDHLEPSTLGFVEVARLAVDCRFADCRHMREPGCAVQKAVEEKRMDARRYESYRRLRVLFENLTTARGPGRGPARRPKSAQ